MKILTPIIKTIGKVQSPLPKVKHKDFEQIWPNARSGDVILSARPCSLSNLFIPGKYKHAGIIQMDNVIEAKFIGVVSTKLIDFCMKKDSLILLRPKKIFGINILNQVSEKAFQALGAPYDFSFVRGGDSYYCSELIEHCWEGFVEVPKRKAYGKNVLNPNDLINHKDWTVVMEIN